MNEISPNSTPTDSVNTRSWRLTVAATLAAAFAYYISYIRHDLIQNDEGILLETVKRMMDGKEWFLDSPTPQGALRFWLLEKFLGAAGFSFIAYRIYFAIIRIIGLYFMLEVGRKLVGPRWAIIATVPAIVATGHLLKSEILLIQMAVLFVIFASWESKRVSTVFLLGLVASLSFWFRPEMMPPIAITALIGLELGHYGRPLGKSLKNRRRLCLLAGGAVGFFAPMPFFPGTIPLIEFIVKLVMFSTNKAEGGIPSAGLPGISMLTQNMDHAANFLIYWITIAIYLFSASALIVTLKKARNDPTWSREAMILIIGVIGVPGFLFQSNSAHLAYSIAPAYILYVYGTVLLFKAGAKSFPAKMAGVILSLLLSSMVVYSAFLARSQDIAGLSMRWIMDKPIDTKLGRIYYLSPRAEYIGELLAFIEANTKPDDPVAAIPEISLIPLMAGRKNPSYSMFIAPNIIDLIEPEKRGLYYSSVLDAEMIVYMERPTRLERQRPERWRFINFDSELYWEIIKRYTFVKRIGDYIVLKRGEDRTQGTKLFMAAWEAFKYGRYEEAEKSLTEASANGAPTDEVERLLQEIRDLPKTPAP